MRTLKLFGGCWGGDWPDGFTPRYKKGGAYPTAAWNTNGFRACT